MKTVEMISFGKGYYVMTRVNGHTEGREFLKTKTAANARVRELKKMGYANA